MDRFTVSPWRIDAQSASQNRRESRKFRGRVVVDIDWLGTNVGPDGTSSANEIHERRKNLSSRVIVERVTGLYPCLASRRSTERLVIQNNGIPIRLSVQILFIDSAFFQWYLMFPKGVENLVPFYNKLLRRFVQQILNVRTSKIRMDSNAENGQATQWNPCFGFIYLKTCPLEIV